VNYLTAENIDFLAIGAAVIGAGGGGDPYLGKLMAKGALLEMGQVPLIEADDIPDDALVIPSAMMGAPAVMLEKLPNGQEPEAAFRAVESFFGKKAYAVLPIEAGGINSCIPVYTAARLGLPLVNADGMGRAFPEIQMLTFTLHGISATPMAMADEKGNSVILNTISNRWTETFSRSITVDMGCTAMIALYSVTGRQLKEAAIRGTISFAETIGRTVREARAAKEDVIAAVMEVTGGFRIFRGKIVDIQRRTETGFARGEATIQGVDEYSGSSLTVRFQNEHLVAIRDGEIVVSVPDLITLLDAENGEPITTEGMRYGFRVVALGIPVTPKWRTPAGLEIVGPRYFGYDIDYVPVEERFGRGEAV
jgi:DUF917 family protein